MSGAPVDVGDVLAGKYRVDRVLSAGGMGVVVAATHLELHEQVCLKFMLASFAANAEAVERFLREARAAAKLKSPGVCRVMDIGRLHDGAPFIVMELLSGTDLAGVVRTRGRVPDKLAAAWIAQVCDTLVEAHELGIIHRDIKPANLFVTTTPRGDIVKVLDFGISKLGATVDGVATQTSAIMGTPAYMSPEQMKSAKHVDGRTDLWALGAVLYELVSGAPPFGGETITEIITSVLSEQPRVDGVVAPSFAPIVKRCLEKDRERRYATAAELGADLRRFAAGADTVPQASIPPTVMPPAPTPIPAPSNPFAAAPAPPISVPPLTPSRTARTIVPYAVAGAAVVAAAGVVAVVLATRGASNGAPPPPAPKPGTTMLRLYDNRFAPIPADAVLLSTKNEGEYIYKLPWDSTLIIDDFYDTEEGSCAADLEASYKRLQGWRTISSPADSHVDTLEQRTTKTGPAVYADLQVPDESGSGARHPMRVLSMCDGNRKLGVAISSRSALTPQDKELFEAISAALVR